MVTRDTYETEAAFMIDTAGHADESELLVEQMSAALGTDANPLQVEALARMMVCLDRGAIEDIAVHSLARHQLDGVMQTLTLRIGLLERRAPQHACLVRLREIRDGYATLHAARIAHVLGHGSDDITPPSSPS